MSDSPVNNMARAMALGLELGFLIAIPLIVFLILGLWLDRKFDTMPLFVIVCLLAGFAAVIIEVKQVILPFLEKRSKKNDKL
jgi:F0F1-type ATP synthase assembly protein I